jgi:hypothetical protein
MPSETTTLPAIDDAARRAAIVEHLTWEGIDFDRSHAMYTDDAILEFPQSGERFIATAQFREWRERYPAEKVDKRIRRISGSGEHWVTEIILSYDGGPWTFALSIDQFRGRKIARQIIYVFDGWDAPEWRAPWATMFNPNASIEPAEYVDEEPFGLEADLARSLAAR